MPMGPGKYDELATLVRERAQAEGVIVIVCNGERGNGFSMQAPLHITLRLPEMLENMAAEIRASHRRGLL